MSKFKNIEESINLIFKEIKDIKYDTGISIELVENKLQRLTNEFYNTNIKWYKSLKNEIDDLEARHCYNMNRISEFESMLKKNNFIHNFQYVEEISEIIISKEVDWDGKKFNNMLVKLVGCNEVYRIFITVSNSPKAGDKIIFTFNADENKLSKVKLLEDYAE